MSKLLALRGLPVVLMLTLSLPGRTQQAPPQSDRIIANVDNRQRVPWMCERPDWASPRNDAGPVAGATRVSVAIMLSSTPEATAALEKLVEDQQKPDSPNYQKFLTPQQLNLYGPTQHDVNAVMQWLTSYGLEVRQGPGLAGSLSVSGTASQMSAAFGTSLHLYRVGGGKKQRAPSSGCTIPAALAPGGLQVLGLAEIYLHAGPRPAAL